MPLVAYQATPPLHRLGALSVDRFLVDYWQRDPCVLRQVFPCFEPALDEEDIAGLACEELTEARLVSGTFPEHDWHVRHGPFAENELAGLPRRNWALLVQDVEKHYPPLAELLAAFGFVPSWRLDDLMASVAAPGGSVGPHVDEYDVFLLQASGRRRWSVSRQFDPERVPGCEIDVLRHFDPEVSWELEPGDILYLPPGVAHHGVALDLGMTWSIGLRAPSQADLLMALGEWLAERHGQGARYQDPTLKLSGRPGSIDGNALSRLGDLLEPHIDLEVFLGTFLTTYRLGHAPAAPERALSEQSIERRLADGALLRRNPWTRMAWIGNEGRVRMFAAGELFDCDARDAELLCKGSTWRLEGSARPSEKTLITELVNAGHLYLDEGTREARQARSERAQKRPRD